MKHDSSLDPQIGEVFRELVAVLAPLLRLLGVADVAASWHLAGMLREARSHSLREAEAGRGGDLTRVQPRDEEPQRGWEQPEAGSDLDPEAGLRRDLEVICHALAGIADSLSRYSPRAVPVDRMRKAINDMVRIIEHATTVPG